MTSFFPDVNVWLALSITSHSHTSEAWNWLAHLPGGGALVFARYTQLGLLRLLTQEAVMRERTLTFREAWGVYDRWLEDSRVVFHPEPRGLDTAFREASAPFGAKPAPKWVGDCYLLACAKASRSKLVTFDKALVKAAQSQKCDAVIPA